MMLTVVGGTYREVCLHPRWDATYGSGVRAAAAVSEIAAEAGVELYTWVTPVGRSELEAVSLTFGFRSHAQPRFDEIEFQYDHALAPPRLYPDQRDISKVTAGVLRGENVLCFGLVECDPTIKAEVLVYDPQAGRRARPPSSVGHSAQRLAILANATEARAMLNAPEVGAQKTIDSAALGELLLRQERCEVVVVKNGVEGAIVVSQSGVTLVPSYRAGRVFPIGSGDVFSGIFAAYWACRGLDAVESARLASAAASRYCETNTLPIPSNLPELIDPARAGSTQLLGVDRPSRRVYLAGPLFTLPQLWLLNEARRCLEEQGLIVFSPKDEVGFLDCPTSAKRIADADLAGLEGCDIVFAILDGLDPGTLFEVGYARKLGLPVVGFAERVEPGELTMLIGTDCEIHDDLSTAIYQLGWKAAFL